jgi:hypothetical protein
MIPKMQLKMKFLLLVLLIFFKAVFDVVLLTMSLLVTFEPMIPKMQLKMKFLLLILLIYFKAIFYVVLLTMSLLVTFEPMIPKMQLKMTGKFSKRSDLVAE